MRRGRQPRCAYDEHGSEVAPLMLATMRGHGVRSVRAWCGACGHHAIPNSDHLPDDLPAPDVALRLRCSKCGSKHIGTRLDWREMWAHGKAHWQG